MDRPTFYYNDKPVRAGGILFYVNNNGRKEYLLRKGKKHWGDVGGKTDKVDNSILDTIVREVVEETNFKLLDHSHTKKEAREALEKILETTPNLDTYYSDISKYILLVCELPIETRHLSMKRFGLAETTCVMKHYFRWWSFIDRKKLHPRLRFHREYYQIFNKLS